MKYLSIAIVVLMASCCVRGQGAFQYDQQVSNTNAPGGYANIRPDPSGQSFVPSFSSVGLLYAHTEALNRIEALLLKKRKAGKRK